MLGGQIEAAAADIRTRVGGYRGDVLKREAELGDSRCSLMPSAVCRPKNLTMPSLKISITPVLGLMQRRAIELKASFVNLLVHMSVTACRKDTPP
jgi:hypothetical protein